MFRKFAKKQKNEFANHTGVARRADDEEETDAESASLASRLADP